MDAVVAKKRNSRWDISPVRDARRAPKVACITFRDIERIFAPLTRYRYLPVDYLHALGGGDSVDYLVNRLNLLSRIPNLYVRRPLEQRANATANHRPLVYELASRGWTLMQEQGFERRHNRPPASFAHELMICQIMASFELGARSAGAQLITWSDILRSENLPEATRRSPKPWNIPVTLTIGGERVTGHVVADGSPFGIRREGNGRPAYFFCPGVEADCGTEPIDASDFARSSIYKKFALYLAIEAQGIYRSHFGFPNLYVPFVTTSTARIASMMTLLDRMTKGAGSKAILFKTFPSRMAIEKPLGPGGHMLSDDWQRVGHPAFNFLTS
jgi:hypothetical protein